MQEPEAIRSPRRWILFWGLQSIGWFAFGLFHYAALHPYLPFADIAVAQTVLATLAGVGISLALRHGYRRLRTSARPALQRVLIAGAASLGAGLVWYGVAVAVAPLVNPFEGDVLVGVAPSDRPPFQRLEVFVGVLLAWSSLYFGVNHWEHQQVQRQRVLKARAMAHQARLQMLRYQLNPHFLFNALNTIGALADEDPARIQPMVQQLSGFLRYSLLDPDALEVPLREELQAIRHYLSVEQIRFEDDLDVTYTVTPAAEEAVVPAFLLLPLIENAIKYGQRTSPRPLRLRITAERTPTGLRIDVANTGRWGTAAGTAGTGTGLRNVAERLAERYPGRARLDHHAHDGWIHVQITIDDAASP